MLAPVTKRSALQRTTRVVPRASMFDPSLTRSGGGFFVAAERTRCGDQEPHPSPSQWETAHKGTTIAMEPERLRISNEPHPPPLSVKRRGGTKEETPVSERERLQIPNAVRTRMVEISRNLRRTSTPGEQALWQHLRSRRLRGRKFRRQHAIGSFVVDFFCPEERLIVEVDGGIHQSQQSADKERQEILESLRYRVLRIADDMVLTDIDGVLTIIAANFSPEPPPLRSTERGPGGEARPKSRANFSPEPPPLRLTERGPGGEARPERSKAGG